MLQYCIRLLVLLALLTYLMFSQAQDYSASSVLVLHLASFLAHCLPQQWLGWDHVSLFANL